MDREEYLVRPFTDRDFEASSRIGNLVNPGFPIAAEEDRHWEAQYLTPQLINEKWVVARRANGEVVAVGSMAHSPFSYHPRKFWVYVMVDPAHRRRGIARVLSDLIESEAASHRALLLWATVRQDAPEGLELARRRGFVEVRRQWMSTLDLFRSDLPVLEDRAERLERDGIRFTTLEAEGANRPDVRQRLFDLLTEASRDVPRMGEFTPISFDQFVGEFEGPSFLSEAYFLACDGETYVAMTNLERSLLEKESLRVGFTGTRTKYRGRGIASELKRRAREYARRHGIRYLRTVNDSLNLPMWAINEREGFRRTVEWVSEERRLAPDESPPGDAAPPEGAPSLPSHPGSPGGGPGAKTLLTGTRLVDSNALLSVGGVDLP